MPRKKEVNNSHREYYTNNEYYTDIVENQPDLSYEKYINFIIKFTRSGDEILDVGCGTGTALAMLTKKAKRKAKGVDVSKSSIKVCRDKKLNCEYYDGKKLPFTDSSFKLVGSFNVLEHTDDPIFFLNENLRVVRSGGFLVVVCPNLLSLSNNYHDHTKGVIRKIINLVSILNLLISNKIYFEKLTPIVHDKFLPDEDAVNATNPISIMNWARSHHLIIKYFSSQPINRGIASSLDKTFLKFILGSVFIILEKP